jgi:spore maturation protein CgeB
MKNFYHNQNGIKILKTSLKIKINSINKKILIVSNNSEHAWANPIVALKNITFKKSKFIYVTKKKKLKPSFLTRLLFKLKYGVDEFGIYKKIHEEVCRNNYDEVLIVQPYNINISTIKRIKEKFPRLKFTALFIDPIFHWNYFTLNILLGLKLFDKIIYRQPYLERLLNLLSKKSTHIRCFPGSVYKIKRLLKNRYIFDVSFIGTFEKQRFEILKFLSENKIKVNIFGGGWDHLKIKNKFFKINGPIYGKKFFRTISQSKINLCFLRSANKDVYNSKVVEILSAGGFMLSEYSKYISKNFKHNKELIFFKNKQDILKKIKYYTSNGDIREKIKRGAYKKITSGLYGYSDQLKILLKD